MVATPQDVQSSQKDVADMLQRCSERYPILLNIPSPKGKVQLISALGKGTYGFVYEVLLLCHFIPYHYTKRLNLTNV